MTPASAHQRRLALGAWIAVCLIWGTTYLGIRVSLETMPPALMGGLRWTVAGLLLIGFLVARGERLPARAHWPGILWLGFLLIGLGNGGVVWAEQWVPSGLTAVIIASSPFWMTGVEALMPDGERVTRRTIAGLLVGFAGIVLLVWPDLSAGAAGSGFLVGIVSLQIACIGWAIGSSYSRRHARTDSVLATTAGQMLAGGLMMVAAGTIRGEWASLWFSGRTTIAFVYLATIGSIGGFVAYTYALRHLPVSFVSLYAYINPVIAVLLGVLLLAEPFDARAAVAAALVLGGVAIVRMPKQPQSRPPARPVIAQDLAAPNRRSA